MAGIAVLAAAAPAGITRIRLTKEVIVATLEKVQIFPAIGIARIGNSQEWYLGPELPFPAPPSPPPGGTYKDANCRIKRQAQRFRL